MTKTKKQTKKSILLELLNKKGDLTLTDAANILYGDGEELSKLKVIRLLAAYRKKDKTF